MEHPVPIELSAKFQSAQKRNINFSAAFYSTKLGELRSVYIHSIKIEIFNLFFFPYDEFRAPIYAMEFVRMGERMVVAVLDVVGNPSLLESQDIAKNIISLHRQCNAHLPQAEDPPQWYQECRSGFDFFVRPERPEQMLELIRLHYVILEDYLDALALITDMVSMDQCIQTSSWQKNYKNHHADNSPGLPFLNRTFGPDWTCSLLREHLFA